MISRVVSFVVALTLAGSAFAQSAPHKTTSPKAATEQPAEPADVSQVPRNVQKWIGGAVDDILTGADKAVNPAADKR